MRIFALITVIAIVCAAPAGAAENSVGARYTVQVRQGENEQWRNDGVWVLSGRAGKHPIELRLYSGNGGKDVVGQVKYTQEEGMLGVNLRRIEGRTYSSETKKGHADHVDEGQWVIGNEDLTIRKLQADSSDGGNTLTGQSTYEGGEEQDFIAHRVIVRYHVEVRLQDRSRQDKAAWQDRGTWVMGSVSGERPVMIHVIGRSGGAAGGQVQYAEHEGAGVIMLNPIEGDRYKAEAPDADEKMLDLGEWALGNEPLRDLYATSNDAGSTLTGYVVFHGGGKRFDFKATYIEGSDAVSSEQGGMDEASEAVAPAWDGVYVDETETITISENGSKITITSGEEKINGEITSEGTTFKGYLHSHGHDGEQIPISGTYGDGSLSFKIADGEAIVHKAAPNPGK